MNKLILLTVVCLGVALPLVAQPTNPNPSAPFGFTEILIAGGIGYAGYKKWKQKREE